MIKIVCVCARVCVCVRVCAHAYDTYLVQKILTVILSNQTWEVIFPESIKVLPVSEPDMTVPV